MAKAPSAHGNPEFPAGRKRPCGDSFALRRRIPWPPAREDHLVDAGGKLPVIIIFVDRDEHVNRVLPKLKEMAAHRLIVRENVVIEQGNLE